MHFRTPLRVRVRVTVSVKPRFFMMNHQKKRKGIRKCNSAECCKYCYYYYLYYYCCQYKCSTAISISKVKTIFYLIKIATSLRKTNVVVSRGKDNKQKSRSTSLSTDKNQYIYSYGKLVTKPTVAYCYLTIPNSQYGSKLLSR